MAIQRKGKGKKAGGFSFNSGLKKSGSVAVHGVMKRDATPKMPSAMKK